MTTRQSNGRKRRRSLDNDDEDLSNTNRKKQKTSSSIQLIELAEYHCCICKELPIVKIYQCGNGCLICETCYPKIIGMKCPLCRIQMNKSKPIRCRIAEKALAGRFVNCRYCKQEITFAKRMYHEQNECDYLPIECKYKELGCEWKGLKVDKEEHEFSCIRDQDDSLKIVKDIKNELAIYQKFCGLCTSVSTSMIMPSSVGNTDTFIEDTDDFYFENYEYILRIKSEKERIRRKNVYKIQAKIVFAEDLASAPSLNSEVHIGLILSSKLIKEMKFTCNSNSLESGWSSFDQVLSSEEYVKMYRDGFEAKIFCFGEDRLY